MNPKLSNNMLPFYKIFKTIRYSPFAKMIEQKIKNLPENISETLTTDNQKYKEIFTTNIDYNSSLRDIITEKMRKEKEIKKFFKKEIDEYIKETDLFEKHLTETISDAKTLGLENILLETSYEENLNLILNDDKFDGLTKKYSINFTNYNGEMRNIKIEIMKAIDDLSTYHFSIISQTDQNHERFSGSNEKLEIAKFIERINEMLINDIALIPAQQKNP